MSDPARGEIWWGELAEVGRRPYLVMTRSAAVPVLRSVVTAPITRTVRRTPSEVVLGPDDGMPVECAANFDDLRVVPKSHLSERLCRLGVARMFEACVAVRAALDC